MRTLLVLATLLSLAGCRSSAPPDETPALLRVASDLDNPPFAFLDPIGLPAGRDVEMMGYLAEALDVELEWVQLPFDQLLPAVEQGDVDLACATLGITVERARRVAFSRPYFHTRLLVVVRDGVGEPRTLQGLDGRIVAAGRGTTAQAAVQEKLPAAVGDFENESGLLALERLLAGEIDATVMDGPAARTLVASSNGRLRILEEDLGPELYALVLRQGRSELKQRVDAGLIRLERNDTLRALDAKWEVRGESR